MDNLTAASQDTLGSSRNSPNTNSRSENANELAAAGCCTIIFLEEPDNLPAEPFALQEQETSTGLCLAVETTGKSQT
jgi:hypothetical protein